MPDTLDNMQLLGVVVSIITLLAGAMWWAIKSLWNSITDMDKTFRQDHVHRSEFDRVSGKLDRTIEVQAGCVVNIDQLSRKLDRLEDALLRHVKDNGQQYKSVR